MRTLFRIWLTLTIISIVFYLPFYVFSNNALNAVEGLTPDHLIPLTGIRGQDPERKHNLLLATGIDTTMELEDALDNNKKLSNVRIKYIETAKAKEAEMATGLKLVEASADLTNGRQMKLTFTVIPKRFLKSNAMVNGFLGINITNGKYTLDVIDSSSDELYLWALFEKSGKAGPESVQRMSNRFDLMVAGIEEQERARERDRNPPPLAANVEGSKKLTTEENGQAVLAEAIASQNRTTPTRQIESHTVAGNPAPDKIVIFQWEGKPAYCADEGQDGPNCRGDGSAFIGQGTYKDYLDPESEICIAGEPDCKLPQYFPADARG
ncbi:MULTISPECIES: hypothetical protein [unclassified Pseudomonas]|uniref:hypothetical protein n=1 Tax=unclassified Pseudomonas TaxID=196821 RepID=UPI000C2FA8A5|nr:MULTISPECIES: hypothetical protein [unclassified Pseudomonas]MCU1738498.1 hypothetical protein [Pseudomonas sp. 20S_6.2_Bac1]